LLCFKCCHWVWVLSIFPLLSFWKKKNVTSHKVCIISILFIFPKSYKNERNGENGGKRKWRASIYAFISTVINLNQLTFAGCELRYHCREPQNLSWWTGTKLIAVIWVNKDCAYICKCNGWELLLTAKEGTSSFTLSKLLVYNWANLFIPMFFDTPFWILFSLL